MCSHGVSEPVRQPVIKASLVELLPPDLLAEGTPKLLPELCNQARVPAHIVEEGIVTAVRITLLHPLLVVLQGLIREEGPPFFLTLVRQPDKQAPPLGVNVRQANAADLSDPKARLLGDSSCKAKPAVATFLQELPGKFKLIVLERRGMLLGTRIR